MATIDEMLKKLESEKGVDNQTVANENDNILTQYSMIAE